MQDGQFKRGAPLPLLRQAMSLWKRSRLPVFVHIFTLLIDLLSLLVVGNLTVLITCWLPPSFMCWALLATYKTSWSAMKPVLTSSCWVQSSSSPDWLFQPASNLSFCVMLFWVESQAWMWPVFSQVQSTNCLLWCARCNVVDTIHISLHVTFCCLELCSHYYCLFCLYNIGWAAHDI